MSERAVVDRLRQQGQRLTPQRLVVLDVISTHPYHMTVDAIHAAVVERQPFVDIATVYRTLHWLATHGFVAVLDTGAGKQRYEYRHEGDTHHHLICRTCGSELQITDDDLASFKATIAARHGFTIDVAHLAFLGVCAACRAPA